MTISSLGSGRIGQVWQARRYLQDKVAGKIEAVDLNDRLDTAQGAAALDEDDEIDRFCDELAWDGCHRFLNQLLDSIERCPRGVCVYGRDTAGMAGIPGLQHVEGFPS